MEIFVRQRGAESPESVVGRVVARLRNHALWDGLSLFLPPLLVALYCAMYFYRAAWIGGATLVGLAMVLVAAASAAVALRWRPSAPSVPAAARRVDERASAQDRFLTLATIEPSLSPPGLVARVRREAAGFLHRVDLKKDFPYRIKRSFYRSLAGSVVALVLFHLGLRIADSFAPRSPSQQLRSLARETARMPRLSELARALEALAVELNDPKLSEPEKQALIQEMLKKLEEQRKEEQDSGSDLLSRAASTLRGLEQNMGEGQERDHEKGGGGVKTNLPQQGGGEGKSKQGGGDGQGEINAQLTKELPEGKSSQGGRPEPGKEKGQGREQGAEKKAEPDNRSGKETAGKAEGESEEKIGKSKGQEIPRGAPPPERFLQPGEQGKKGIEDARFVTVQLPEAVGRDAGGAKQASGDEGSGKGAKLRPKVPVSNVPLPAHLPDAPAEKQPLPLEYRGMIR